MNEPSQSYINVINRNVSVWLRRTADDSDDQISKNNKKFPNLINIIEQALAHPKTQTEEVVCLVAQSYLLIEGYGRWLQWIPYVKICLSILDNDHYQLRIELFIQLGKCFSRSRQLETAIEIHQQANSLAVEYDHKNLIIEALHNLSVDYRCIRDFEKAREYGLSALQLATDIGIDTLLLPIILNELGLIALQSGDLDKLPIAEQRFSQALKHIQAEIEPTLFCKIMINLGQALQAQNRDEEALATYQAVAGAIESTKNELDKSKLWNSFGVLYFKMGQLQEAQAAFQLANSEIVRLSGDIFVQASLNQNIGNVLLQQKRVDEAGTYLWQALRLWEKIDDRVWLANTYGTIAEMMALQSKTQQAELYYTKAIEILSDLTPTGTTKRLLENFLNEKNSL